MLTGRESLCRLIGKRRRFLPNFLSILSSPIQSSLNLLSDKDGSLAETECSKGEAEISSSDLVTWPVCGNKVRREDCTINSHLGDSKQLLCCDLSKNHCGYEENVTCGFSEISPSEEKGRDQCGQLPHTESVKQIDLASSTENPISDGRANFVVDFPALSTDNEESRHHMDETVDSISERPIDTYIVGRKFSDGKDVNLGACISLLTDSDNIKDPNAIKVILQVLHAVKCSVISHEN